MSRDPSAIRGALAVPLVACLAFGTAHAEGMTHAMERMATDATPARAIANTTAELHADAKGVRMTIQTRELTPGHVTTAWWVIMTNPADCGQTPCRAEDVIGRADEVGTQIVFADGAVNAPDGTARFAAYLPAGTVASGWYDRNIPDLSRAEIHRVLNDHGPLTPEIAASMLTSYRGGCSDESLPRPFPDAAKADGIAGRNPCVLIQDAIFVPQK
ncbi:hypothetical protein [Roseobacter sinensis]|uniref:Lipoprotein n=1 Tax=Roseobacter sinensis TaxID=2931391 RepID=A0ABT3BK46_9RHOB|nr:hypothetical protein [Roseobacter sp. WL0113]MCV3273593.1 hypothetical protein [Roseobacter sp. WL0113]